MAQTDLTVSLSEHDRQVWQMKLWELLRLQTARYTSGQSTSVRTDTAQMLLRSICFSLEQLRRSGICCKNRRTFSCGKERR